MFVRAFQPQPILAQFSQAAAFLKCTSCSRHINFYQSDLFHWHELYFSGDMLDPVSQTNTFPLSNMAPQYPNHNRGEPVTIKTCIPVAVTYLHYFNCYVCAFQLLGGYGRTTLERKQKTREQILM